jgi:hypothetical protein
MSASSEAESALVGHVPMLAGRILKSPKILGKRNGNVIAVETASLRKYINLMARKVASTTNQMARGSEG